MPVEILELVIKATVKEGKEPNSSGEEQSRLNTKTSQEKTVLIQEVVDQVMELLKQQKER